MIRPRKKSIIKILNPRISPLPTKYGLGESGKIVVRDHDGTHNHPIRKHPATYAMYRKQPSSIIDIIMKMQLKRQERCLKAVNGSSSSWEIKSSILVTKKMRNLGENLSQCISQCSFIISDKYRWKFRLHLLTGHTPSLKCPITQM